jgi:formylglycine-generating enzyme required for sulfatase activity
MLSLLDKLSQEDSCVPTEDVTVEKMCRFYPEPPSVLTFSRRSEGNKVMFHYIGGVLDNDRFRCKSIGARIRPEIERPLPESLSALSCQGKSRHSLSAVDVSFESDWIAIDGGTFLMGTPKDVFGNENERPAHQVDVPCFAMMKNEVTFSQYQACIDDGVCISKGMSPSGKENPVTNVSWLDAATFCRWAGGRLPSEAEWEYAARSRGKLVEFSWGDSLPDCDVSFKRPPEIDAKVWGQSDAHPVCSKASGNTEQGLCDMTGNVAEWVQDTWHDDYHGAPDDGSAWDFGAEETVRRVIRGGHFMNDGLELRIAKRRTLVESAKFDWLGFRCAASLVVD